MIRLLLRPPASAVRQANTGRWKLRGEAGGETAVPVRELPFVIGRWPECQLILPGSAELDKATSRWHCHIVEENGSLLLVDGSLHEVPELGARKASGTGTWVNGTRLTQPRELKAGDVIAVGPWTFGVEAVEDSRPAAGDARLRENLARLDELTRKIARGGNIEENIAAILNCAATEFGCADTAALLVEDADERCSARLAWQRTRGRLFDFPFDAELVGRLPKDRGPLSVADAQDGAGARIGTAVLIPLWGSDERLGVLYLDNRRSGLPFTEDDLHLAGVLAGAALLQLLREKEVFLTRVASSMSQYFGPEIVGLLVDEANQGRPMLPEVKEQNATILFVDLTGFSRYCRGRSPREVSELLNPYLQLVAECIQRHSGHVDKFIGDGVMGVFGALPLRAQSDVDHARQAVRAAREIISLWAHRSTRVIQLLLPIRAGINTGRVVAGNIGYAGRMEYSVLGDPVNLASRMEKLALPNGIALTDATHSLLGDEFECVDAGIEAVRGFGAVRVWRMSGAPPA